MKFADESVSCFRADYILSQVFHFVKVFFTKIEKITAFGKINENKQSDPHFIGALCALVILRRRVINITFFEKTVF